MARMDAGALSLLPAANPAKLEAAMQYKEKAAGFAPAA
jgi:hypothetical protein